MVQPSRSPCRTDRDERNIACDVADDRASEIAVERWLTSPVVLQKPLQVQTNISAQDGDFQKVDGRRPSGEIVKSRTNSTAVVAYRGKCLLRERLKQKALREQQQMKALSLESEHDNTSSQSITKLETAHKTNEMQGVVKEPGNITPSTAASTRSSSSKSFSLANSRSGMTLSDAQLSPTESTHSSPRNHNSTHAIHARRSIEIPELGSSKYSQYSAPSRLSGYYSVSQPSSPSSRLSNSVAHSSPRSSMSRDKNPESPQSLATKSTVSSATSRLQSPSTSSKISQQSVSRLRKSRISISQRTTSSQQGSDEEREIVDQRTTQRAQTVSSDRRQQHAPCLGRTNRIKLHVYDLIAQETIMQLPWGCHFPIGQCFNALNSGLHTLGTGAYHVGIEINGIEYAYGANETTGLTGVFTCMPKSSPGYQYRTTIDLGDRVLIRNIQPDRRGDGQTHRFVDGREVVREMAAEYMGTDYDLLRKNCVTFAHDACLRLGVKDSEVPEWFRNLCLAGAAAQDAANSTMAPLTRVFSSCDMEGLAELVKDAGFEVISDEKGGKPEQIIETNVACSKS